MTTIEAAVAARVIAKPLLDLYEAGRDRFSSALAKWKNAAVQKQLVSKVASTQKVKTFWQRDREVSLSSFYYPSKVIFPGGPTKSASSLSELPSTGNFAIQGTVGQGKSIFLRHLCVQELREAGSGRIPIFIELRTISAGGLVAAIRDALDRLGFVVTDELFDFYAKSGKLVVLLDAFDELDESAVPKTVTEIEALAEKYNALQMFVTTRPQSAIQNSRHLRVIQLAPLTPNDHEPFLKRIGIPDAEIKRLIKAIRSGSSAVSGLLTTPLMMTLLVVVYRVENTIPSELPEFYERLFQTLFSKHDASKPGYIRKHKCGLGERRLQQLFEAFCFATLQLKQTTILSAEVFGRCFEQALKHVDFKCELEGFKHDITHVTCLMQEEGFDTHFIHKSVLEFYAASFVRGRNDAAAERFYSQLHSDKWRPWSQVLQFLSQIDRYRYTKYFAVPAINWTLTSVGLDLDAGTIADPETLARRVFRGVEFSFKKEESGKLRVYAIGPFRTLGKYLDNLSAIVTMDYDYPLPRDPLKAYTAEEFRNRFPNTHDSKIETAQIAVDWAEALAPAAFQKAIEDTRAYFDKLIAEKAEFVRYLGAEETRGSYIEI